MRARIAACIAAAVLTCVAVPASAHHSFAADFDAEKPVKMTGPVTKVEWTNPHVWFYVDVKASDGNVANWALEMGSPNGLLRTGWTRNSLKIGDVVTVEGYSSRNKINTANASAVTLASTGQKMFAASSGPR
jgi:hypothetical protein